MENSSSRTARGTCAHARIGCAALATAAAVVLHASPARADVQCGDIIGPRATVVLQEDLRCTRDQGGV